MDTGALALIVFVILSVKGWKDITEQYARVADERAARLWKELRPTVPDTLALGMLNTVVEKNRPELILPFISLPILGLLGVFIFELDFYLDAKRLRSLCQTEV